MITLQNSAIRWKKLAMIVSDRLFRQAQSGKYECCNITATYCKFLLHTVTLLYTYVSFMHIRTMHSTLLFCCGTRAYLISPDDEGGIRNNCREFHASDGVILQSDHQSCFRTPVCGLLWCKSHGIPETSKNDWTVASFLHLMIYAKFH